MSNPFSQAQEAKPEEAKPAQYFVISGQLRYNRGKLLNPGDAIPDGILDESDIKSLMERGIIGHVGSSPHQPAAIVTDEKMVASSGGSDWPFQPLAPSQALHPNELLGLDIEALNEQSVAAGWKGEAFTDVRAAIAFLSANFKPGQGN